MSSCLDCGATNTCVLCLECGVKAKPGPPKAEVERLRADRRRHLDLLQFSEGALVDVFAWEDGVDKEAARRIAMDISKALVAAGETSVVAELEKQGRVL